MRIEANLLKGIELLEMDKDIDIIKPSEIKEIKLILSIPRSLKDFSGQEIPFIRSMMNELEGSEK
jgi:hypothetical protein